MEGSEWLTATPTSGTIAPTITQDITLHFDTTGLPAGTKYANLTVYNNSNYIAPSSRGDNFVIPISLTVTIPSVPFVALNTDTWDINTVVGTPVGSGSVFQIKNVGVGTLTITSATGLTGTPFTTNFNSSVTLTLGQTHDFSFTYTPTGPGVHTATFTIVTNGGTKTITLAAHAVGTNYLSENFAGTLFPPAGWVSYDVDGDGYNWYSFGLDGIAHSDTTVAGSASYINDARNVITHNASRIILTPNNWLVTPRLAVGTSGVLAYWIASQDPDWPAEHYSVMVSTTNNQVASFTTELFAETLTDGEWHQRAIDLTAYTGQNIYLAFRHHDCTNQFVLKLDDVQMPPLAAPLQYGNIGGFVRRMVTNQIIPRATISIAGRYVTSEVDGSYLLSSVVAETYQLTCSKIGYQDTTITAVIPANNTLTRDIFMDWGDAVPNQTNFTESQNVNLTESYPFSFSNPGTAPLAWEIDSGVWGGDTILGAALNEDFEAFEYTSWSGLLGPASDVYTGYGYEGGETSNTFVFESEHCTTAQWLITPLLSVQADDHFSFWYKQFSNTGERLDVLLSTTNDDTTAFTNVLGNLGPLSNVLWTNFDADLSGYAGSDVYIAFHYTKTTTPSAYMFVDMITGPPAYISPENWLSSSLTSGSLVAGGLQNLTLDVNTTGLVPGNYTGQTWIFTDGVSSPVKLYMDLTVFQLLDADIPANLTIQRESQENLNVLLDWDVSDNAVRYHIYACAEPLAFDQYTEVTTTTNHQIVITPTQLTGVGVIGDQICFRVTADNETLRRASSMTANLRTSNPLAKIKSAKFNRYRSLKRK